MIILHNTQIILISKLLVSLIHAKYIINLNNFILFPHVFHEYKNIQSLRNSFEYFFKQ